MTAYLGVSTPTELSMTDQELEQFKALAAKYESKDKDAVKKIIQDSAHDVFQDINDGGRAAANEASKKKLEAAEALAKTEKEAREKVEKELKELEGKAPDVAKLKEKYEAEVQKITGEKDGVITTKDKEILEERLELALNRLKDELVALKVDPDYADTVLIKKDDVRARLKPLGKGKVDVLKAGSQDLTLVAGEGETPIRLLAKELVPSVPKKWIMSGVGRGSATSGSKGGGEGGQGTRFDTIRTEVKEEVKQKQERVGKRSGLERLSGRR